MVFTCSIIELLWIHLLYGFSIFHFMCYLFAFRGLLSVSYFLDGEFPFCLPICFACFSILWFSVFSFCGLLLFWWPSDRRSDANREETAENFVARFLNEFPGKFQEDSSHSSDSGTIAILVAHRNSNRNPVAFFARASNEFSP